MTAIELRAMELERAMHEARTELDAALFTYECAKEEYVAFCSRLNTAG